ncbi:MAG: aminopeptidase N [Myxococcaceae bacterium]|nr:aminopeptidase N [Myxococcaceae bacterium]
MLRDANPKAIRLVDYRPPDFAIDSVALTFDLDVDHTEVEATLALRRLAGSGPLTLQGDHDAEGSGQLLAIMLDGKPLPGSAYELSDSGLTLKAPPERFTLTTRRRLSPSKNKSLEGLYASGSGLFTQCEAEGFRKITWYLDRPDVMSVFTVTLRADPKTFPVLLSNGNKVSERDEVVAGVTRRVAVWHDPHKKPSYLFAVVAGNLVARHDTFTTMSGKTVDLNVWVRAHDLDQTAHCMDSLKKSMRWDETRFGREYDLDVFNLVAVSDFNMGAMENKGLNVFNTKFVLARPDTATDVDFAGIEGVVGHEYFHNWSGNRVTCRDWFQLSLKEGFTVFRDQEFSADVGSRAVKRIEEVRRLRSLQFPEDAGPTAHPVRPDSYVEISNFYTVTIYEKGAEVVRMQLTLLGEETFRKGTDLYFSRHDGQAVTTDDFLKCMAEVSGRDFTQFQRWYSQAGTPKVTAKTSWNAAAGTWTLELSQVVPPTPGQSEKLPMHLPVVTALLGAKGQRLPLVVNGDSRGSECVLELTEATQTFVFSGLSERPVPSLLRGFSAPVVLETDDDEQALLFRLAHDDDAFNRVEAGQELFLRHLLSSVAAVQAGGAPVPPSSRLVDAIKTALATALTPGADPSLLALALSVPGLDVIGDRLPWADYGSAHVAREHLVTELATQLSGLVGEVDAFLSKALDGAPYRFIPEDVGRRSLRNLMVGWRARLPDGAAHVQRHLARAGCMTDTQAALALLSNTTGAARDTAFADFYARWKGEALMVDKWFALQATSTRPQALDDVFALVKHEAFTLENPNRARSVIAALGMSNPLRFHEASGRGYVFLGDLVRTLDAFNPQIAARMLTPLTRWRRQDEPRQALMKRELQRVLDREGCSKDVYEIASKSLA